MFERLVRRIYKRLRERYAKADRRAVLAMALALAHYATSAASRGGGGPLSMRAALARYAAAELLEREVHTITNADIKHIARQALGDPRIVPRTKHKKRPINWEDVKRKIWLNYSHLAEE